MVTLKALSQPPGYILDIYGGVYFVDLQKTDLRGKKGRGALVGPSLEIEKSQITANSQLDQNMFLWDFVFLNFRKGPQKSTCLNT